jgi:hypothetical protein
VELQVLSIYRPGVGAEKYCEEAI